jgi:hypothetical protein
MTNKLGFYVEVSDDNCGLWDAIGRVQPPVILFHRNSLNKLLLHQIRKFRAPNAFVIGRVFLDLDAQERALTHGDPAENGRKLADDIIRHDFGLASERGANGRLLIDAWMSLNEAIPGPASSPFAQNPAAIEDRLRRYDRFQAAFGARLREASLEAVAFNFAAGNFSKPEHYLDYFPETLSSYTYLGFHEYGWPTLFPAEHSSTGAGLYRTCMAGIRQHYGNWHKVIITELGMTREYRHPFNEPRHPEDERLGDLGWLNHTETLSEEQYWASLAWYNQEIAQDDYVLGACLYQVGHSGRFFAHRHLGQDNDGRPLRIIDRIVAIKEQALPLMTAAAPATPRLPKIQVRGRVTRSGAPVSDAVVTLTGDRNTLSRLRRASVSDADGRQYAILTKTDAQGKFHIRDVPAGEYTLAVSAPAAQLFTTAFSTASSIRLEIPLTPAPVSAPFFAQAAAVRHIDCGINIDPANPAGNPSGDAVRELGATWVRLVFKNRPGQPLGESFAEYDRVVNDMRQAGVQVLMILNNESCPGKPPREALDDAGRWREYIAKFAARCGEVANHYRDNVAAYQIWNEPDHPGHEGYDPTMRAGLYGEMLRAAFQAIRPVTSSPIVTAGMAFGDPNWVLSAMAATGNQLFADILAVHPYGRRPKHHWPHPTWGELPGPEMIDFLRGYRHAIGKPIWVTEYGTQDRHTVVAGSTVLAGDIFPEVTFRSLSDELHGIVTKCFWFCWSDGMVGGFGLLDGSGQRKSAYHSFQAFARQPFAALPMSTTPQHNGSALAPEIQQPA